MLITSNDHGHENYKRRRGGDSWPPLYLILATGSCNWRHIRPDPAPITASTLRTGAVTPGPDIPKSPPRPGHARRRHPPETAARNSNRFELSGERRNAGRRPRSAFTHTYGHTAAPSACASLPRAPSSTACFVCTYTRARARARTQASKHAHTHTHTRTHAYTRTRTRTRTRTNAYTSTYARTHADARTRKHARTHTRTDTHTLAIMPPPPTPPV